MNKDLANALHKVRHHLLHLRDQRPDDRFLRDAPDLVSVLIHAVEGMEVIKAFGAPGDWGYGTPIGDGLVRALQESRR